MKRSWAVIHYRSTSTSIESESTVNESLSFFKAVYMKIAMLDCSCCLGGYMRWNTLLWPRMLVLNCLIERGGTNVTAFNQSNLVAKHVLPLAYYCNTRSLGQL